MRSMALLVPAVMGLSTICPAQTRQPDPVALALLPLPDTLRAAATVVQYGEGVRALLRRGTNGLTCVADQPGDLRLSPQRIRLAAARYHGRIHRSRDGPPAAYR